MKTISRSMFSQTEIISLNTPCWAILCLLLIVLLSGCATATTIKVQITSDPAGANIYAGESPENLRYSGITPKTETFTAVSPCWKAWYYQIQKPGYEDSEIIFKPQGVVSADRYVHATLRPKVQERIVQEQPKPVLIKPQKYETVFCENCEKREESIYPVNVHVSEGFIKGDGKTASAFTEWFDLVPYTKYTIRWEWYHPRGQIHTSGSIITTPTQSHWRSCHGMYLDRKYNLPSGLWSVKIYVDDSFITEEKFLLADSEAELAALTSKSKEKESYYTNDSAEIDPQGLGADDYFQRGLAYGRKGQYDKAIADYTKSIEINPGDATVYISRGFAYVKIGQYDKAIADVTKAIEINPGDVGSYKKRGLIYSIRRQYDKAIADFTKAIEINPRDAGAYQNRGSAYGSNRQYDKAIAETRP